MATFFRLLAVWFLITAVPAHAEAESSKPVEPLSRELITPGAVMQLVAGLAIVIAAIFLVAWLLRRIGGVNAGSGQLRIVAGLALGQRERVVLIQVGERQQVLLGVTSGNITRLAEYDEPVVVSDASQSDFAERLRGAMGGQGKTSR